METKKSGMSSGSDGTKLRLWRRKTTDRQEMKRIFLRQWMRMGSDDAPIDVLSSSEANVGREFGCMPLKKPYDSKCKDFSDGREAKWASARVLRTPVSR